MSFVDYDENIQSRIHLALVCISGEDPTGAGPSLPLTTGMDGLEVNYKLGSKIAAEMAVDGFVAPVLNPNAANVAQVKGTGGNCN